MTIFRPVRAGLLCAAALGAVSLSLSPAIAGAVDHAAHAIAASTENDPLRLVISRDEQRVDVYRGSELIASSPVSTGKRGYETPLGVYSILGKRKVHYSNRYGNAPMPFMQRITWSGIALHAGRVPGYPASHGCIRLPRDFAIKLFRMTRIGADVIVTSTPTRPQSLSHDFLFQPAAPTAVLATSAPMSAASRDAAGRPAAAALADLEYVVARMPAHERRSTAPVRILVTWRTGRQKTMDIQRMLRQLGHDPGAIDGLFGKATARAIKSFQSAVGMPATGVISDELVSALYRAVGRPEIKGHIYVRQNRRELFDAPIAIADPQTPLGTHVYSVDRFDARADHASWSVMTLKGDTAASALAALDRLSLPDHIRRRISELLTPGSSLIVSDAGLGRETGKGTDFIVQLQ